MTRGLASVLLLIFLSATPSIQYFKYRRLLQSPNSTGQHYAVVDEQLWQHTGPALEDVRIYAAGKELPYKLTVESGGSEIQQKQFRVLQPASVEGKTEFLLDMSGVEEYDRVELKLGTRNFVAHARVEGQDDVHGTRWALLGSTTLYDLTDEKLGNNSTLRIPVSAYKYLRVTVDSAIKPTEVKGGTAGITRAEQAVWREIKTALQQEQIGKDTVLTFAIPANTPVERLTIDVDPAQRNFRRMIEIRGAHGESFGAREISRIHMLRSGQKVDVEQTSIELCGNCRGNLQAVIHNGDDVPLKISATRLQQYERRIYFEAEVGDQPWVYYGDEKLRAPEYDYSKLFQRDPQVEQVALTGEEINSTYTGRPDERPWSERHPAILWITILAAVMILGGIAMRSLKSAAKPVS